MAASGLTPGSDAWSERLAAEEKGMRGRLDRLQGGATGAELEKKFHSMFSRIPKLSAAGRGEGAWRRFGGGSDNPADVRKGLEAELERVKKAGPNLLFASEEKDIRKAEQSHQGELDRIQYQIDMTHFLDKGAAKLAEMGIEREAKPFEMFFAASEGTGDYSQPAASEEQAALEEARRHGSGRGRRPFGMADEEDIDRSKMPWI